MMGLGIEVMVMMIVAFVSMAMLIGVACGVGIVLVSLHDIIVNGYDNPKQFLPVIGGLVICSFWGVGLVYLSRYLFPS